MILELSKGVHCVDLGESFQFGFKLSFNLVSYCNPTPRAPRAVRVTQHAKIAWKSCRRGSAAGRAAGRTVRRQAAGPMFVLTIFSNFWMIFADFERPLLGCIEADFCKQIRLKALDEIYKIYRLSYRTDLEISAKKSSEFF